jgi:hypothetical protein
VAAFACAVNQIKEIHHVRHEETGRGRTILDHERSATPIVRR